MDAGIGYPFNTVDLAINTECPSAGLVLTCASLIVDAYYNPPVSGTGHMRRFFPEFENKDAIAGCAMLVYIASFLQGLEEHTGSTHAANLTFGPLSTVKGTVLPCAAVVIATYYWRELGGYAAPTRAMTDDYLMNKDNTATCPIFPAFRDLMLGDTGPTLGNLALRLSYRDEDTRSTRPATDDADAHPEPEDQHIGPTCAYIISGTYGPAPRAINYVVLSIALMSSLIRKEGWLSSATGALAIIYGLVAAIHGIVLCLSLLHTTTLDTDIIPVSSITCIGTIAALLSCKHWHTFGAWKLRFSVAALGTMFLAAAATGTMLHLDPAPWDRENCNGQSVLRSGEEAVPVTFSYWFNGVSFWASCVGIGLRLMWELVCFCVTRVETWVRGGGGGGERADRTCTPARGAYVMERLSIVGTVFACLYGISVIIETELIITRDIPISERNSAVGQWGPILAAVFGVVMVALKARESPPCQETAKVGGEAEYVPEQRRDADTDTGRVAATAERSGDEVGEKEGPDDTASPASPGSPSLGVDNIDSTSVDIASVRRRGPTYTG